MKCQSIFLKIQKTRTVFSKENVCPPTSLNRHIVEISHIYNFSFLCVVDVGRVRGCSNNFSIFVG